MREVTMVLFPTPSNKKKASDGLHRSLFSPAAHHPRLEECAHPVAFPIVVYDEEQNQFPMNEDEGASVEIM